MNLCRDPRTQVPNPGNPENPLEPQGPQGTKETLWEHRDLCSISGSRNVLFLQYWIGSAVLHLCRLEPQGPLQGPKDSGTEPRVPRKHLGNTGTFVVFLAHVMFGSCNIRSALPSYICAACLIAHVVPLYILGSGGIEFGHLPIIFLQHLPNIVHLCSILRFRSLR